MNREQVHRCSDGKTIPVWSWLGCMAYVSLGLGVVIVGLLLYSSHNLRNYDNDYFKERRSADSLFLCDRDLVIDRLVRADKSDDHDSILSAVIESQYAIIKRQEDLVNDLRQETNNNIDKINALIAFSIGILSLFGVIIPIVMQFKAQHEAKAEIRRSAEESKRSVQSQIDRLTDALKDKERALRTAKEELDKLTYVNRLGCISQNTDFRTIPELGDSNSVAKKMWDGSISHFEKFRANIFGVDETDEAKTHLLDCLTQIITTLNVIRVNTSRRHNRSMDRVMDDARRLIHNIANNRYESWKALGMEVEQLIGQMRHVVFQG